MKLQTYEVFVGESLPALKLFLREDTQLIAGLDGSTFELKVATLDGEVLFTKTSGITGQAGGGFPPVNCTPNVVIAWAAADELDKLTGGQTYLAQLKITTGGKSRYVQWLLAARTAL